MLKVRIINPDEIVYEGEAEYILAPGSMGHLGILPGHTPYFGELNPGEIVLHGAQDKTFKVESGLIKIRADEVMILIGL